MCVVCCCGSLGCVCVVWIIGCVVCCCGSLGCVCVLLWIIRMCLCVVVIIRMCLCVVVDH